MSGQQKTGFRCYICGKVFQDQTQRARPCGYDRFGHATCKDCCERCHDLEPIPCPQYTRRKRREKREARKA